MRGSILTRFWQTLPIDLTKCRNGLGWIGDYLDVMATVTTIPLPKDSLLHRLMSKGDFVDCYAVASTMAPRTASEIIVQFPGWARFLLHVRRFVTAPFGLSNDGPDAADKLGPFPVEKETDQELLAGFNDKHLDFRISVFSTGKRVSLATWVHPHNLGGRFYLALIMPFHIMIAKNALVRVAAHDRKQVYQASNPS